MCNNYQDTFYVAGKNTAVDLLESELNNFRRSGALNNGCTRIWLFKRNPNG